MSNGTSGFFQLWRHARKVFLSRKTFARFSFVLLALGGSSIVSLNTSLIQAAAPPSPTAQRTSPAPSVSAPATLGTPNAPLQVYKVEAGDNIYLIAQKVYGDSAKFTLILNANNLNENNRLNVGMLLKIPPLPTATVSLTPIPTATVSRTLQPVTPNSVAASIRTMTPENPGRRIPEVLFIENEESVIMAMLTNLASATLVGSSAVCALLALVVFSSARRGASQQTMARRVRPPVIR